MKWRNRQFGEFEFDEQHVLIFPEGIIGFEQCRRFILVSDEDSQPFRWLVSLEDEDLSFPMLDPRLFISDYDVCVGQDELVTVLVVVTLREEIEDSSANLRSPIIIANQTRIGKQVILENEACELQYPIFVSPNQLVKG